MRYKFSSDLSLVVEASDDLTSWNSGAAHLEQRQLSDNGLTETIAVRQRVPMSSRGQGFMRLTVVRP